MTKNILLERLKDFTEQCVSDLIMPTRMQEGDKERKSRAADVYLMRLPDSSAAKKKAPYIIHQVITGKDLQTRGNWSQASTVVRTIFSVYSDDEQEGGLMLLNLMERLRIGLLKEVSIGNQFVLDLEEGLETLVYPDDTAPYFGGEMISTWKLPSVKKEVIL